ARAPIRSPRVALRARTHSAPRKRCRRRPVSTARWDRRLLEHVPRSSESRHGRHPIQGERPDVSGPATTPGESMELELNGWKVKAALIALLVVVVCAPFARASMSNKGRADDWHRRAVVAEEAVGGLRVVIAERSRVLNARTLQANQ